MIFTRGGRWISEFRSTYKASTLPTAMAAAVSVVVVRSVVRFHTLTVKARFPLAGLTGRVAGSGREGKGEPPLFCSSLRPCSYIAP